jgi:predicted methyltransferase
VLIVDAYHEVKEFEAMLEQIRKALNPGGRLVIADYSDRPGRNQPREEQTKIHFLSPGLVSEELKHAGLEIMKLDDPCWSASRIYPTRVLGPPTCGS